MTANKRSSAHARQERLIFDAFLRVYRSLGAQVREVRQPDDEFPDVVVRMTDGTEIDFELGEWLDGDQMAAAKRRERLEKAIGTAIGPQGKNLSHHFRSVMLSPREDFPSFAQADSDPFKVELFALLRATEEQWPTQRSWHSPQGHACRDLATFPVLARYLESVLFDPLTVRGSVDPWPTRQPYIFLKGRGTWYSPATALAAMTRIIDQKVSQYGQFGRPTRLLIYYGKAIAYNTPYYGGDTREFADVAKEAASVLHDQKAFEKVYLFKALTPGAEAFEISPTLTKLG